MTRFTTALLLASIAIASVAVGGTGDVSARLQLIADDRQIAMPPFGQDVDLYHLTFNNDGPPLTSLDVELLGPVRAVDFFSPAGDGAAFRDSAEIPQALGFEVLDTFFVVPPEVGASNVLATAVEDSTERLAAAFTYPGDTPVVPTGRTVLAVVMASPDARPSDLSGSFLAPSGFPPGSRIPIIVIPEPSAVALAFVAITGGLLRRHGRE